MKDKINKSNYDKCILRCDQHLIEYIKECKYK